MEGLQPNENQTELYVLTGENGHDILLSEKGNLYCDSSIIYEKRKNSEPFWVVFVKAQRKTGRIHNRL